MQMVTVEGVRDKREALGMTYVELSHRSNVAISTILKMEKGEAVKMSTAMRVSAALKVKSG